MVRARTKPSLIESWVPHRIQKPFMPGHHRQEFFLKLMISLATGEGDPVQMIYVQRASPCRELHAVIVRHSRADPKTQLALVLLMDLAL